jgi:hypothetical protein
VAQFRDFAKSIRASVATRPARHARRISDHIVRSRPAIPLHYCESLSKHLVPGPLWMHFREMPYQGLDMEFSLNMLLLNYPNRKLRFSKIGSSERHCDPFGPTGLTRVRVAPIRIMTCCWLIFVHRSRALCFGMTLPPRQYCHLRGLQPTK